MSVCGLYIYVPYILSLESACPYVVYIYVTYILSPESTCPYVVYLYVPYVLSPESRWPYVIYIYVPYILSRESTWKILWTHLKRKWSYWITHHGYARFVNDEENGYRFEAQRKEPVYTERLLEFYSE